MRANRTVILLSVFLLSLFICGGAYCVEDEKPAPQGEFTKIFNKTPVTNGARIITYAQFMKIRNSDEKFVLVDVLSRDDYATGHIEGAISFPVSSITRDSALKKIPKYSNVIVYCLSSACPLSVEASCKLSSYEYKVLDYKGGLDEWQDKGNKLVR